LRLENGRLHTGQIFDSVTLVVMLLSSILSHMKEATVIYPHQLFTKHPGLAAGRVVYLVEEPLLLTEFPTHRQKLLLHRLSMQEYKTNLEKAGYQVQYLDIHDLTDTESVFTKMAGDGVTDLHIADTTDSWLEKRIRKAVKKYSFTLTRYESPLFLLEKEDAVDRYVKSKKHMAAFYKQIRRDKNILIDTDGEPTGGKWSFDEDNRNKLPKKIELPKDITFYENADTAAAQKWLEKIDAELYGETNVWIPYTHGAALELLQEFLRERFYNFGTYEDALTTSHTRVFHSTISPLLNIGLLTPQQVVDETLAYATEHGIELNNLEGFIRQIVGWREFIRAAYECDGSNMRTKNFWKHTRPLPNSFWNATTNVEPIDHCISTTLKYGYNHHIERLMVLGNFMLLTEVHPDEVYTWFMAMYVDAYDWVMVPNVYGMSQFADGGSFATKPYISGSNYLKKMSDYPAGSWEETWTALYWRFIGTHRDFFLSNYRLSMMPRLLEKMSDEKKQNFQIASAEYFANLDT
jgi:deoxyribodipyrimidine photolyase-related protein